MNSSTLPFAITADFVAVCTNFVILIFTFKIKAEIAELKLYMHQHFEPLRKQQ